MEIYEIDWLIHKQAETVTSMPIVISLSASLWESGETWPNWAGLRKPIISPAAPVTHGHQMWVQPQWNAECHSFPPFSSFSLRLSQSICLSVTAQPNKLPFVFIWPLYVKVHHWLPYEKAWMWCFVLTIDRNRRGRTERKHDMVRGMGEQRVTREVLNELSGIFMTFSSLCCLTIRCYCGTTNCTL